MSSNLTLSARYLLAAMCALTIAACNAPGSSRSSIGFGPQPAADAPVTQPKTYVYVANSPAKGPGSVAVFLVKNATVAQRIKIRTGISKPMAIELDSAGNLYVANANFAMRTAGWVTVYAPGSTAVLRRLSSPAGRFPDALAFDRWGNLYVANEPYSDAGASVDIYPSEGTNEIRSIAEDGMWTYPTALAVNLDGSLYIGNTHAINLPGSTTSEYAPGATTPELTFGTGAPQAMLVDRSNNVYLASQEPGLIGLSVDVFAPNSSKLVRSIPAFDPSAIAFDREGDLYVANTRGTGFIAVFAPESKRLLRRITAGISAPTALGFDSAGNLYVANAGNNSVTVYAPGKTTVLQKITRDVNTPIAVAAGTK